MTRRTPTRPRAYAPDPDAPGRLCDIPSCGNAGEYRAPKSRTDLTHYWWFCLAHVREYNAGWDFYKGMTPGQIEAQLRADTAWQRPTWPLGRLGGAPFDEEALRDPLANLAGERPRRRAPPADATPAELREPLGTLGLEWPVSLDEVKTRYKELAKRHHPDANGGDRAAEERLKTINLAYAALRSHISAQPAVRQPQASGAGG
ncbi:MAG: J domain-containing protein [Janthinobacterium lividum]